MVTEIRGKEAMAQRIDEISANLEREKTNSARESVAEAWKEYRATLVIEETEHGYNLRNAVRPGTFFNLEDLHFNAGFFRILPGLFITVGLFLTFLGLISALASMVESVDGGAAMDGGTMATLLNVASAKFIMSLIGLLCSIVFTIALRFGMGQIEDAIHRVNRAIEERLSYISLEEIALAQVRATREQQEHFRKIAFEMVAEFGRPLREELPQTISTSISDAMSPLLKQVGQMSSEGVGDMVRDLSSRFSDDGGFDMLVLGPRAAGTGLTLTAATHVIHLSRWWNPAVEEQCNDRVHRIGQSRPVSIHIPMAVHPGYREHSFDCLLQSLMNRKRRLATAALWPMGDTQEDASQLQRMLEEGQISNVSDPVSAAMEAMFRRDAIPLPSPLDDGSFPF